MVYVVGHRGAAGIMPENTIKGFRYAIQLGVDYVECDLHLSRDGYLMVMHDNTVDRTTNGRGAVRDLLAARIRSLDAGDGEQVPTLDEVLETVRHEVHLLIELKGSGVEQAAVAAVRAHDMVEDVTFSSFSLDRLARVRQMGKEYRVRAILPDPTEFELARAAELQAVGVDIRYTNVCLRSIEAAHALGLEVLAWNPDTWQEQQAMIALGVDGVSSNRPDILLEKLGRIPTVAPTGAMDTPTSEVIAEPTTTAPVAAEPEAIAPVEPEPELLDTASADIPEADSLAVESAPPDTTPPELPPENSV